MDDVSSVLPEMMSLPLILGFVIALLLFFFVVLMNIIRRRLHVMERQLVDIGADLRIVSLRLAMDELDEPVKHAGDTGADMSEDGPSVSLASAPAMAASAPPLAPFQEAAMPRARYINNDAGNMPVLPPEAYHDYADNPSNLSSADLLKQTHFDPPVEAVKTRGARRAAPQPPPTPEEDGDIWRLRATPRAPIARGEGTHGAPHAEPPKVRKEPTLKWPPKSPST
ncbi:hypothetical protein N5W20_02125 [Candidatus Kirkpatrickella diaphorinae]|uniref:Uncharacterized protein n=1 Tax=Candidatus Kirkpatrickella diaphorinae TaxID=2984322 RepID=A0ABY6GLV1_9PROT|nr:hypothetical protein [Candidatus Kirkpatrickella diaphorinae]UYH51691.1 hypothetical protein N5W20_02125 [Candidatus Kirkpatrickella diaphorinae]